MRCQVVERAVYTERVWIINGYHAAGAYLEALVFHEHITVYKYTHPVMLQASTP